MVPISGSAYTYAYATLGELVAWIIGWDLIIEYAVGNIAVAISWSATSRSCCKRVGSASTCRLARIDYVTAAARPGDRARPLAGAASMPALRRWRTAEACRRLDDGAAHRRLRLIVFNLPAFLDRRAGHRAGSRHPRERVANTAMVV